MARLKQIGIDVDVHRAIEQARQSFSESENDILRRLFLSESSRSSPRPPKARNPAPDAATRTRGLWAVDVKGERTTAANMKEAYRTFLLKLDEISPNFFDRFAGERSRSRKFIARRPDELYDSAPHLAAKYARQLKDGWYFDTNLSTEQVAARVRVAARVAGLAYGRDLKLLENLRLI